MTNHKIKHCCQVLINKKLTIAFAESATAGRMVAEFSMVPDASKFLKGGLVCYDANLKQEILGVPKKLIEEFTPESPEVTQAIAKGLQKLIKANIHVGVTGLPAPGGSETTEKPVGTMFIYAILNGEQLFDEKIILDGEPEEVILKTIEFTAEVLVKKLS